MGEMWVIKTRPDPRNSNLARLRGPQGVRCEVMIALVLAVIAYCRAFFIGRHRLGLEVAAPRQQLAVFKRKQPRPHLCDLDRAFWVALRRLWPGCANALIEAGYRGVLASCCFSPVLAMAVAA